MPKSYWAEAVLTATLLVNITPSSAIGHDTPYSRMYTTSFDYTVLRTFGCVCYVLLFFHEKDKLSSKSCRCIFVGYSPTHKGYRCYDPVTKRLRIAKHVSFLENLPYYSSTTPSQNVSFLQPPVSLPIPVYAPPAPTAPPILPDTSVPSTVPTDVHDTNTTEPCSSTDASSTP